MRRVKNIQTTSFFLHILAMIFMLLDHMWATVVPGNEWMTCVGRLAFPIFAFLTVEGYFHTKDLKKYILRLFIFALVSEIPFNLMTGSSLSYYPHQNVLFSFLTGILLIHLNENARKSGNLRLRLLTLAGSFAIAFVVGLAGMVDYLHGGIMTVLIFYLFRGNQWWCYLGQLLCLYYINVELLGGYGYNLELFGRTYFIVQQGFALFALIPIWLYKGKQGPYNRFIKNIYYWFYPVHMLILVAISFFNN